jgi:hypothetical protein
MPCLRPSRSVLPMDALGAAFAVLPGVSPIPDFEPNGVARNVASLTPAVAALLEQALACVPDPSATQARLLGWLRELAGRLRSARLQVAVVGQFKRGKSSLLNALLGAPVLPVGVVPLTAITTILAAGPPGFASTSSTAGRPNGSRRALTIWRANWLRWSARKGTPGTGCDCAASRPRSKRRCWPAA